MKFAVPCPALSLTAAAWARFGPTSPAVPCPAIFSGAAGLSDGDQPLTASIGGVISQGNLVLSVKR
jgi:hypothetical protein